MDKKTIEQVGDILGGIRNIDESAVLEESTKDAYYRLADAIYGLEDIDSKDPVIKKISNKAKKLLDELERHLNKNYKGWD